MSLSALVLMNGMLSGHFIPFRRVTQFLPIPTCGRVYSAADHDHEDPFPPKVTSSAGSRSVCERRP
jgi:hypothetical protein